MESDLKRKIVVGVTASFLMLIFFLYLAATQTNLTWNNIGSVILVIGFIAPIIVLHVLIQSYIERLIVRAKTYYPEIWERLKNEGKIFPLLGPLEGPYTLKRFFFHTPVQIVNIAGKTMITPPPPWLLLRPFAVRKATRRLVSAVPKDEQLAHLSLKIERVTQLVIMFFGVATILFTIFFYWLQS
jgi:hypothetical protein